MNFLISIITPAYNASGTIERTVESVLAQTYTNWELIIVDDKSKDNTIEVVDRLASTDSRIRFVKSEFNRGQAGARNLGLSHATGEWLALLDADDAYTPDRLERLVKIIQSENPDFLIDNMSKFDGDTFSIVSKPYWVNWGVKEWSHLSFTELLRNSTGLGRSFSVLKPMMRREFMVSRGMTYNETLRLGEDFEIYCQFFLLGAKAIKVHAIGYLYREEPLRKDEPVVNKASFKNKQDCNVATLSILTQGDHRLTLIQKYWLRMRLWNMSSYELGHEIKLKLAHRKHISAAVQLLRHPWFAIKLCLKMYLSYAGKSWSHYALISSVKR